MPTLLGQGQADTLFNLQESVATYTALKRQGTPVALVWQSWGHSDSTPQPGELDMRHPADSLQGRQALAWFDHYVRGSGPRPPLNFSYYRDWVYEATGDIRRAYATAPCYPVGRTRTLLPVRRSSAAGADGALVGSRSAVVPGTSAYASIAPIGPNYTETSALDQSQPVTDPPGSAIRFATAPLTRAVDVVGSAAADRAALGAHRRRRPTPGTQLVVFAKLYDIGPDGTVELPLPADLAGPHRRPVAAR